ncbi:hypothetical protein [Streptomyces melanosporofaciens]|uniref:hypothetical protein n=1 Tax=Streptomyces melanosporofaciens TaxID=67327 RepID=UPI000B1BBA4E
MRRLVDAGVRAFELSSFVRPDLVPGLADAAEVFARVPRVPGLSLGCCVANLRGLARAVDAGADTAYFLLSADEEFARANTGRSTQDSMRELERMAVYAADRNIVLGTYVIFAWGGPTGPRAPPRISNRWPEGSSTSGWTAGSSRIPPATRRRPRCANSSPPRSRTCRRGT